MDQKVENLSPKFSNISFVNIESFFIICLYFFLQLKYGNGKLESLKMAEDYAREPTFQSSNLRTPCT